MRAVLVAAAVVLAASMPAPASAAEASCPVDLTTGQCQPGTSLPPPPPGHTCWYEIVMSRLYCLAVPIPAAPNTQSLRLTVPARGDVGLTWEIEENDAVTLNPSSGGYTGTINPVRVIDHRPAGGWSASGQASTFTSPAATIPASALTWAPRVLTGTGVVPGPAGNLATPAVLASTPAGHPPGEARVGAALNLTPPAGTAAGRYASTLTLTVLAL